MSATLGAERFTKYYNCPMIHIPKFSHPVKEFYFEDLLDIIGYVTVLSQ